MSWQQFIKIRQYRLLQSMMFESVWKGHRVLQNDVNLLYFTNVVAGERRETNEATAATSNQDLPARFEDFLSSSRYRFSQSHHVSRFRQVEYIVRAAVWGQQCLQLGQEGILFSTGSDSALLYSFQSSTFNIVFNFQDYPLIQFSYFLYKKTIGSCITEDIRRLFPVKAVKKNKTDTGWQ